MLQVAATGIKIEDRYPGYDGEALPVASPFGFCHTSLNKRGRRTEKHGGFVVK
jgi:hypothetical protein